MSLAYGRGYLFNCGFGELDVELFGDCEEFGLVDVPAVVLVEGLENLIDLSLCLGNHLNV